MTERCYKCGRVRITHAPEHDGATGYFEWREAEKCFCEGTARRIQCLDDICTACGSTGRVLGTDPAIICPECAKEAKK